MGWVSRLVAQWPRDPEPAPELRQSLAFLGVGTPPATLLAGARMLGVAFAVAALPIRVLAGGTLGHLLGVTLFGAGVATAVLAPYGPRYLARLRRTRSLGAAPALITRATLRMRTTPVPERAARFAARTGEGPLADSLQRHVERSAAGPGTGLRSFAAEWTRWFPALERSITLLESAGGVTAQRREAMLDRARAAVLDATRERAARFGARIQGPASGVYAFGVLLPLALVALLPAVRTAGVPAPFVAVVVVYDLALPVALVCATGWLLVRRPLAVPPPSVGRTHPAVRDTRGLAVVAGFGAAASGWLLASALVAGWTASLAAVGFGLGTGLVVAYRPMVPVRHRVQEIEAGVPDALALAGRRVAGGRSAERALAETAATLSGPIGEVVGEATRRQRELGLDLERALFGAEGPLTAVPSRRTRTAARTVVAAAEQGTPAGETVVAAGEHLAELATVERETRRSLAKVTSTLANTGAVFGPLVGGATVALGGAMSGAGPLGTGGDVSGLGLAVGGYVLVLAAVVTTLATGLSRGLERSLVGYRIGLALVCATTTYLSAFAGTALVV